MSTFTNKPKFAVLALAMSALLAGCDDDDDDKKYYQYEVKVQNLTYGQPVSPAAVAFHESGALWQVGEPASDALEVLAESGDNTAFLAQDYITDSASGAGVIMPGMSETVMVKVYDYPAELLTVATMLVNTNDAFSGVSALDVSDLMRDESISLYTRSYDAGTEANSETSASIPGPAAGGEGFNSERDDVDFVAMHAGVVSSDDGLSTSVLTQAHRFDNPTLKITVSRVK